MAIGVNWKEVWADVWGPVWVNTPPVTVPDVVGLSQAQGTSDIEAEGLVVAVETAYSSTVPAGDIISQVPTAGSSVLSGSTVTITVSLGPEPAITAQTPAGSSNRRKRRLYVEIDGQAFEVESAQHAQALFDRAKALAQEAATEQAERVERKLTISRKVPKVTLEVPEIKASPELKLDLKDIRKQIAKVYQDAAMALEMRLLLERQAQVDEEESIFLLM